MLQLSDELVALRDLIEGWAAEFGLDFFSTIFEMVDYKQMSEIAAYGGFPNRYPHWRFGMEYEQLSKSYTYGLSKIYEMVINNDPCYAYLLLNNQIVDQKLVMAHVYAHCDFFKNNVYFQYTNRNAVNEFANHASRIRRLIERIGLEPVESFIDTCLSLDNLIDIHHPAIRRRAQGAPAANDERPPGAQRLQSKTYMDRYINPTEFLARQQERAAEARAREQRRDPPAPERDLLLFLLERAPLTAWQQQVLEIVREEAYYFAPQAQTKIMNEGWASYWHSKIMTERACEPDEVVDFADHHAGTMAVHGGQLNPYKLGLELFRDIEERWDQGRFGKAFEECDDAGLRATWDKALGLGREKIFEVRRLYCDVTFIDEFLTPEFCARHLLYAFDFDRRRGQYVISSRKFEAVKQKLLFGLTNFGQPVIEAVDANHDNRGELLLAHRHEGVDLDLPEAQDTLKNLCTIWSRPVHIETVIEEKKVLLSYNGKEHSQREREGES